MTTRCQLCGAIIEYCVPDGALDTDEARLYIYDRISAAMWFHIEDQHPTQRQEAEANQARAAKMYAMNWADHTETMTAIKMQWRQHMLIAMSVTTRGENDTPERYAARHPNCSCGTASRGACIVHSQAAAEAAGSPAAGSNAKKSERNRSN